MPGSFPSTSAGVPAVPRSMPTVRAVGLPLPTIESEQNFFITGVTKDAAGAALGGCTVYLLAMIGDRPILAAITVSDVDGNYRFYTSVGTTYWVIDYKAGAPDVGGMTVNNLQGA